MGFLSHIVEEGTSFEFKDVLTFLDSIEGAESVVLSFEAGDVLIMDSTFCAMVDTPRNYLLEMFRHMQSTLAKVKRGETGRLRLPNHFGAVNGADIYVDYEYPTERPTKENCYYVLYATGR